MPYAEKVLFRGGFAMCGIIGYIGSKNADKVIINALKRMEYRGYDSSGIALIDGGISVQ